MLAEMEQLCDTLAVINGGQLIEMKSIHQLKESIVGSRRIKFKVDYPNFAGKVVINEFHFAVDVAGNSIYVTAGEEHVPEISKRLLDNGLSIFRVEYISKTLEEIFMDLIKSKTKGNIQIF
jgi:ABC-2 type transport system ATP-binding protein